MIIILSKDKLDQALLWARVSASDLDLNDAVEFKTEHEQLPLNCSMIIKSDRVKLLFSPTRLVTQFNTSSQWAEICALLQPLEDWQVELADKIEASGDRLIVHFYNDVLCSILPQLSRVRGIEFSGVLGQKSRITVPLEDSKTMSQRNLALVLEQLVTERERADRIHGQMPRYKSKEYWLTALIEEVGEVARSIQDEGDSEYSAEMIQVAGVALTAVVDLMCTNEVTESIAEACALET